MDVVSPEVRSRMMAGIHTRDTKPEVLFRKGLHRRGFRYSLRSHATSGKPDLVMPKYRVVVFTHGCFWHRHDCSLFKLPRTRRDFWKAKLDRNHARDAEVAEQVRAAEWRQLTVWECAFRGPHQLGLDATLDIAERWIRGSAVTLEIRGRA